MLNDSEGGQKKTQPAKNKDAAMHRLKTCPAMRDGILVAF